MEIQQSPNSYMLGKMSPYYCILMPKIFPRFSQFISVLCSHIELQLNSIWNSSCKRKASLWLTFQKQCKTTDNSSNLKVFVHNRADMMNMHQYPLSCWLLVFKANQILHSINFSIGTVMFRDPNFYVFRWTIMARFWIHGPCLIAFRNTWGVYRLLVLLKENVKQNFRF